MYTGTMIEDLIATVELAEYKAVEPVDVPVAYLIEQSYGEQLVEVA